MTPPSSPRAGRSTVSAAGPHLCFWHKRQTGCECHTIEAAEPCSGCHGTLWTEDENWSPTFPESWDGTRSPGDGLIPCGFCNLGGWNEPVREPAAASPAGPEAPGIRNRLLVSRFDPSVSLDELIGAGSEAVPQSERPDAALRVEYNLGRRHGYEEGYRAAQSEAVPQSEREGLDDSDIAALHELERDLAANEVEHMGDVWQRLRAILDAPGQRALAARLASPAHPDEE
jgi:hypothetical protein